MTSASQDVEAACRVCFSTYQKATGTSKSDNSPTVSGSSEGHGHGALGALHNTPTLTAHYASIGLRNVVVGSFTLTQIVGGVEIALAMAVLIAPLPSLLIGICLWKMGTEALFMTSGSLPFEWIERAGSYTAPLALYALRARQDRMAPTTAAPSKKAAAEAP